MAIATLTIDLVAKLANLERDLGKIGHLAEQQAKRSEEAFERTTAALRGFGAALAGVLSVGALASAFDAAVDSLGQLDDMAEKTGASVENLSALVNVAKIGGHEIGSLEAVLIKMNRALAGGDEETKGAGEALKALGLSAKELRELDPAEALLKISQAFAGFADDGNKSAIAMQLFGKSGAEALPYLNDLAATGALVATVTADQAAEAERFQKATNALGVSAQNFSQQLVTGMLPVLNDMLKAFTDTTGQSESMAKSLGSGLVEILRTLVVVGGNVAFVFRGMGTEIGAMAAQLAALGRGDFAGFKRIGEALREDAAKNRAEFDAWEKRIMEAGSGPPPAAAGPDKRPRLKNIGGNGSGAGRAGRAERDPNANLGSFLSNDAGDILEVLRRNEQLETEQARRVAAVVSETESGKLDALRERMRDAAQLLEQGAITEQQWLEYAVAQNEKYAQKTADVWDEFMSNGAKGIQQAMADYLFDPFAHGIKGMLQGWDQMLRRMIAEAIAADLARKLFGSAVKGGEGAGMVGTLLTKAIGLFGGGGGAGSMSGGGSVQGNADFVFDLHRGGIAGQGGSARNLRDMGMFATAPRFHTGGVVGLAANEVPAVLRRGERVLTPEQAARGGGITINVTVPAGTPAETRRAAAQGAREAMAAFAGARRYV